VALVAWSAWEVGYEVVVDAELVVGDGSAPSFYGVAPALARCSHAEPVGLAVFDLLWCEGHELVSPRRGVLGRVLEQRSGTAGRRT